MNEEVTPTKSSIDVLHSIRIPTYAREFIKECKDSNQETKQIGPWQVHYNATALKPSQSRAIYSLADLVVNKTTPAHIIISETSIELNVKLKPKSLVVAPRVRILCEQDKSVIFFCNAVFNAVTTTPMLLIKPDVWVQCGPLVTPAYTTKLYIYPELRKSLPPDRVQTTETQGVSYWHLLALNALDKETAENFIKSTMEAPEEILVADMREAMTELSNSVRYDITNNSKLNHLQWEEIIRITAYRTPFELCQLFARPFLSEYGFMNYPEMHPILELFAKQTQDSISKVKK